MKKIKAAYWLFFFAILEPAAFAQLSKAQKIDSLHAKFVADSSHIYRAKKYKFLLALDNRNSFVHTNKKVSIDIGGLQLGVVINDKHSLALGFYSAIGHQTAHAQDDQSNRTVTVNTKMGYATLFYEYEFFESKRWELGVPVEIGRGYYQTSVTDSAGRPIPTFHDTLRRNIALFGTGIDITFKIWRWLGLNVMGGYRFVGGDEPKKINLNGIFYSYGLQIGVGELYRMARLGLKRRIYKNALEKAATMPD
jgi:hypothetical protein